MLYRPRPNSNALNKVAIGYKKPLCLTRAKQVQPALYNGHEIIKDNHTPAIMYNSEDTLEIAEITRKKMNDKMNDPECLKYQNLKDIIGNNPPTPDKHTPDFDSVFVIGKMQASLQGKDNVIRQLKKQLSQLQVTCSDTDRTLRVHTTDSQITKLTDHVTHLYAQNDLFRVENNKIKQHYKELYDSIRITRTKHIEQVTKLTTENVNLKTCVSKATVNPQVSARDKHAIVVKPIVPHLRNNRDAHLDYLRHLKESVETIHDIIEEAKVIRPRDRFIVSACRCTKHSHELLEYAIGTYPQGSQQRAKQLAHIPLIRKKQVTVAKPSDKSDSTTHRHVVTVKSQKTNVPVPPSTANRISPAKGDNKLPVDNQPKKNKSYLRTSNHKMADVNPPSGQTPTMAPPVRANDQILLHIRWVPIGKSNCYLDLEKSQSNPIYKIAVDLLKNTNFFRAFIASSTIPSVYIQQFWDTILYDKKAGCYKCQLDEQWKHRFYPRPDSPLHLSNEELVLGYLKFSAKGTKREVFRMPIPDSLITTEIQQATYYTEYLAKVTHHRKYLAGETGGVQNPPTPKPT
nr:integrase, catalytic region, zinc finger, CCHC-type, peptidase aspartic, catalytic [Tanacetum cinerariifolium]